MPTRPEEKGNVVFELIPVAIVTVIGAVIVNGVTNALPGGWTGSALAGLFSLVLICSGLIKAADYISEDISTREKVERAEQSRKQTRARQGGWLAD